MGGGGKGGWLRARAQWKQKSLIHVLMGEQRGAGDDGGEEETTDDALADSLGKPQHPQDIGTSAPLPVVFSDPPLLLSSQTDSTSEIKVKLKK